MAVLLICQDATHIQISPELDHCEKSNDQKASGQYTFGHDCISKKGRYWYIPFAAAPTVVSDSLGVLYEESVLFRRERSVVPELRAEVDEGESGLKIFFIL